MNPHDRTPTLELIDDIERQKSKIEVLARSGDAFSYRLRKAAERELARMQEALQYRDGGE